MLPGVIGTIQATEAVKLILAVGKPLIGRLLLYDALQMSFDQVNLRKDPDCPVCSKNPTVTDLIDHVQFCGVHPAEELESNREITPAELRGKLHDGGNVVLLDVREPHEWAISHLEADLLIPQGDLPTRMSELNTADEIVLFCLSGERSARALNLLHDAGFRRLEHLVGHINAWARTIDPTMPQY